MTGIERWPRWASAAPHAAVQNFMRVMQSEQPRAILITSFEMAVPLDTLTGPGQLTLSAQANVFVSPAAAPVVEAPAG